MNWAVYEVTGKRQYRGHDQGTQFEALHDRAKERAIARGDIRIVREYTPAAPKGGTLPWGWPPQPSEGG